MKKLLYILLILPFAVNAQVAGVTEPGNASPRATYNQVNVKSTDNRVTTYNAFIAAAVTAATSGFPVQISPAYFMQSNSYNTTSGLSETWGAGLELRANTGASTSANLYLRFVNPTGTVTLPVYFTQSGNLALNAIINSTSGGNATIFPQTTGTLIQSTTAANTVLTVNGVNTTGNLLNVSLAGVSKLSVSSTGLLTTNDLDNYASDLSASYTARSKVDKGYVQTLLAPAVSVSSASTLTLTYAKDYVFSGTTTTWTLPPASATNNTRADAITIKNRGSGNITLNTATGAVIYDATLVSTITIAPGSAVTLIFDGTYFNKE